MNNLYIQVGTVVGPFADVETMCLLKDLVNKAGSEMVCTEEKFIASNDFRSDYTFNSTIMGIEEADAIVIIGSNPRYEAPLINARIRKAWLHNETEVDVIGSEINLSYTYNYHGNDPQSKLFLSINIFHNKHFDITSLKKI